MDIDLEIVTEIQANQVASLMKENAMLRAGIVQLEEALGTMGYDEGDVPTEDNLEDDISDELADRREKNEEDDV